MKMLIIIEDPHFTVHAPGKIWDPVENSTITVSHRVLIRYAIGKLSQYIVHICTGIMIGAQTRRG